MKGYAVWMAIALVAVIFITASREGFIRDAAWTDACADLARGQAISGNWNTIEKCEAVR